MMKYAGSWSDMPEEEDFQGFLQDIEKRRMI
jgi:hypothetical protein